MNYYEIQFYKYNDERCFFFYCKRAEPINSNEEMIAHLHEEFPVTSKFADDELNCIKPKHYHYMQGFRDISAEEFTRECGIIA